MLLKSSKVNEFRLWGLFLSIGGMLIMVIGMAGIVFKWGTFGKTMAAIFFILGLISIFASMAVYFMAGMMSTNAVVIQCPECSKPTKMIDKMDRCMFCKTILSMDPAHATAPAKDQIDV